ncbi:MAG TPA: FliG C-terminal domain-containing protein [Anaerohalosphaeraceae bacterium]|nr:FliG C-terminal domain-containing protein [Anaerohalosphaeraceae bacterium]HQG04651.1 FliG C-terminal domain-containing protein [Anaerohalosphaeraceae bacterium]HQI06519.1 FliG C-terminal domain-containing protein [Anaerohalosphaeraceae bacterium]HQJ68705.1 FliG C-terminal domain-containing protein [Anaerohalosphaeraceae bacterium]
MRLRGIQKAALLLTTLDAATAKELLKGQPQDVIQKIAMELSQLDAQGRQNSEEAYRVVREFCGYLHQAQGGTLHIKSFVNSLIHGTAGKERAAEMQARMQQAVREKDPFLVIASAPAAHIAAALENEPPQAIALVLSALPTTVSTEVLNRLDAAKSQQVIWRMTQSVEVSPKTMRRIGEILCKRILDMTREETIVVKEAVPREMLRKVALVLSGLDKEKRDALLKEIEGRNKETAKTVKALMVTWEDIIKIEDRSLQQVLRNVEPTILAKALHGADPAIAAKIRSNISERAAQMVDEETSLMGEPRKKEVLEAREEVVKPLREANEAEELLFIEEER